MDHAHVARLALTIFCGIQGAAQLAIDLNRTHATNPEWPGHARFHLVWQSSSVALLAAGQLLLLWLPALVSRQNFYLAAALAAVSPVGFLTAFVSRRLYGGRLYDRNGIQPIRFRIGSRVREVDMNLVAVVAGMLVLGVVLHLY